MMVACGTSNVLLGTGPFFVNWRMKVSRDGQRTQRRTGEKQTSPRDREQYPPGSGLFSGKSIFNHPRDPTAGKRT
jgi:uncharacterized membrane protein